MTDPLQPAPIFIISDGTGETAEKVVRAGLRQFEGHLVLVRTFSDVKRPNDLRAVYRLAEGRNAMLVTTMVDPIMRETAVKLSIKHRVLQVDLIGGLLAELGRFLDKSPQGVPGLLHQADDQYYQRIEAVEFTVRADDGKNPKMLADADIVLVGVSRTSKTPLSTFLAHKGFKVANQPLVLGRTLPEALFDIDQGRVFALTISPDALIHIRRSRLRAMRMPEHTNYGDMGYILAEIEFAEELYRGNPRWPILDVTNRAIEETAATIVRILRNRGYVAPLGDDASL